MFTTMVWVYPCNTCYIDTSVFLLRGAFDVYGIACIYLIQLALSSHESAYIEIELPETLFTGRKHVLLNFKVLSFSPII